MLEFFPFQSLMQALSASSYKFSAHNHYENLICHNFATRSAKTIVKMLENLITNILGAKLREVPTRQQSF